MPKNLAKNTGPDYSLKPTQDIYDDLQKIYEHLNWRLFDDRLPHCLLTLQHNNKSLVCFSSARFKNDHGKASDEIALNPVYFDTVAPVDILIALVKEMVHVWQHYFGVPGRGRYCNRQWVNKIKAIGLRPSPKGKPGSRETGDSLLLSIIQGSLFEKTSNELLKGGLRLSWKEKQNTENSGTASQPTRSGKRVKYTCPVCGLNAWAKHGVKLICGEDGIAMKE